MRAMIDARAVSAANAPTSGLLGVLGTLVTTTLPPSTATRSVKVPPTSTPTRISSEARSSLACSSAICFFSSSFSSRALAAMAFTASNSSRRGMSMPSRILAIWSRTRASTSSFTPVSAPMAPLAILVRSSMKGLRVCMTVTPDAASMGGW